jgi:hypothetical protein
MTNHRAVSIDRTRNHLTYVGVCPYVLKAHPRLNKNNDYVMLLVSYHEPVCSNFRYMLIRGKE